MKRFTLIATAVFVACAAVTPLWAQSAHRIDSILALDDVTYGDAAFLIVGALGELPGDLPDDQSNEEALSILHRDGPVLRDRGVHDTINLGEFALVLMHAMDIPGGILYTLTGGPRYAARELEYLEVIQGRAFPRNGISGERSIRILGRALALREEGRF